MSASYCLALAVTLAVELPLVAALSRGRVRRMVIDAALLNLVTHPLAAIAFTALGGGDVVPGPAFLGIEAAVVSAEASGYRWLSTLPWSRAFVLSATANVPTALLSFVLARAWAVASA